MSYHYGMTIKRYRELRGWTQARLAAQWPGASGEGVNTRYVQEVEYGRKKIDDPTKLRVLATALGIPLWEFGLSEFNPFASILPETGLDSMTRISMDMAQTLIQEAWRVRLTEPMTLTEKIISQLQHHFQIMREQLPPTSREHKQFLRLYAQVERLQAVILVEKQKYAEALQMFSSMLKTAQTVEEPALLALAYMGLGVELDRAKKHNEAILALETARDCTFHTSKNLAALVHSFLARAYAGSRESTRFERAIDTAINLAAHLGNTSMDETDFVFHSQSAILEEKSNSYITLGNAQRALEVRPAVEQQIRAERNSHLDIWIPLDWAQAYFLAKEVEESVRQAKDFFHKSIIINSPHILSRTFKHLNLLEQDYGDVEAVREFREEIDVHVYGF